MNKEQAVTYLKFSGFSDEQIKAIEGAFACDKCVYSTSEGCQYDDITETIPPFEDCISRQAVIDEISKARDINLGILPTGHRSYEDILRCVAMAYDMGKDHALNVLRSMPPVNPQKPICPSAGVDCEDCPAYEPKILNKWIGEEVLDRIRNEMHATAEKHEDGVYYLRDEWVDEIIDKYAEEGKA